MNDHVDDAASGPGDTPNPDAGWYADPHDAGQLRYWDGSTWTEYTNAQVPFAPPVPAAIAARRAGPSDGRVNDIGQWLRSSFRVAKSNLVPGLGLTLVGLLPLFIVGFLFFGVIVALIDAVAASSDSEAIESYLTNELGPVIVVVFVVALLAAVILGPAAQMALLYLMHRAHVGSPVGMGEALGVGFKRCWRYLGWNIVIVGAMYLAIAVCVGLAFGASALSESLGVVVIVLAFVLLIVALIYFGIRVALLPVACAVAPSSALRASLEATKGRFWPVLGRLLIVSLLSYAAILPVQLLIFGVVPFFADLEVLTPPDATGAEVTEMLSAALLVFSVMAVLYLLAIVLYQIFSSSALARLYADLGGADSRR